MLYKIAITGPESTGKSTLAKALGRYFRGEVVEEYAREYISQLKRHYQEEDLLQIAESQLKGEDEKAHILDGFLFCDTELTVIDIWGQEKYGRSYPWIKEQLKKRTYDLYLLCDIDLEWEPDPQRENQYDREHLLNLYRESLEKRNIKYYMISGQGVERLNNAVRIIENKISLKV